MYNINSIFHSFNDFVDYYSYDNFDLSNNNNQFSNNLMLLFKKGNKIHIKEKNKGSFTKWCGGNVTQECINKGKHSLNPKIRKKAIFAENARHFKHG